MSSPVVRARIPEPLRERVEACAQARGVTVSAFVRQAVCDRVTAVEAIEASALRARARSMADELRVRDDHRDQRAAALIDALLLDLACTDALYGRPVVA
jgi:hypothetical protein